MPLGRKTSTAAFCCLFSLAGCRVQPGLDRGTRERATDAVNYFRALLNAGNCDAIYSEASDEFHGLESREEWIRVCEDARASLGLWTGFALQKVDARGPLFHENGAATFSTGGGAFDLTWLLDDGRAKLFSIYLRRSVLHFLAPRARPFHPPLIDPPPAERQTTPVSLPLRPGGTIVIIRLAQYFQDCCRQGC